MAKLQDALVHRPVVVICGPSGMQLKGLLAVLNQGGFRQRFIGVGDSGAPSGRFPDDGLNSSESFRTQGMFIGEEDRLDKWQQRRLLDALSATGGQSTPGPLVVLHNLDNGALVHRFEPGFARVLAMNAVEFPAANADRQELERLLRRGAEMVSVPAGTGYRELHTAAVESFVDRATRFPFPNNFEDIAALLDGLDLQASIRGGRPQDDLALVDRVLPTYALLLAESSRAHSSATARAVMGAYAAGTGLQRIVGQGQSLDWDAIHRDVQQWVGVELQRIARLSGVPEQSLINRSARQLQNWRRAVTEESE